MSKRHLQLLKVLKGSETQIQSAMSCFHQQREEEQKEEWLSKSTSHRLLHSNEIFLRPTKSHEDSMLAFGIFHFASEFLCLSPSTKFLKQFSLLKTLGSWLEWWKSHHTCARPSSVFHPFLQTMQKPFTIKSLTNVSLHWLPCLRCRWEHTAEDVNEVVQPPQVAILPVPLHPGCPVVQRPRSGQGDRLSEVDHPHSGLPRGIVHKQKRAAHNLWTNQWDGWV